MAVMIAALAVVAVTTGHAGRGPAGAHAFSPRARLPGAAGVAAAYGYPSRCVIVTITADGAFARADFSHTNVCGRWAGDPTAIFHRTRGTWRRVLDAVSYRCPVEALPGVVQRHLSVCP